MRIVSNGLEYDTTSMHLLLLRALTSIRDERLGINARTYPRSKSYKQRWTVIGSQNS